MQKILFVTSSPRGWQSYSHQVAQRIVDELKIRDAGAQVVVRDVARQPVPQASAAFVDNRALPRGQQDEPARRALALSDVLVDELLAADVIVIGAPMHNFGVPSSLKAWIDQVVRPGLTFSYSEKGPQGLVEGKQVVLVLASGGVYSSGPMQRFDFQEPYLRAVLGFIGMTDVEVVRVEGVGGGDDAVRSALDAASAEADAVVRRIGERRAEDTVAVAAAA